MGSPHAPSDYLLDQFKRVKREVAESARPDVEIHWTEWNSISAPDAKSVSWSNSPSVDNLYSGSFVLNHAVRADDWCDSQSWWTVSDIFGEPGLSPLPYSNTYGMITSHGIPKPSFIAFQWLSRMTGERLSLKGMPDRAACQALVTREAGCLRALCWYHPAIEQADGEWAGELELSFDRPMRETRGHLGVGHGSANERWLDWGSPASLTPAQEDALRRLAEPAYEIALRQRGPARLTFTLKPYEVLFLEWSPADAPAGDRGIPEGVPAGLDKQLGEKSRESGGEAK